MIVDEGLEKPINCWCGEQVEKISIAYGRTPYVIYCSNCKSSLDKFFPDGIGYNLNGEHAVMAYREMCWAIEFLKIRKIKPTPERLAEYWCRQALNLGYNPHDIDAHYEPTVY